MTPEKHSVVQRLALLEDTQMIYQALLAKLFVIEKMELGGITRSHLDIIEGEYLFLHRATNDEEKFLISTDFFRRLGDIMYYKNGLIGFGLEHDRSENGQNLKVSESFINGLYYWGIDIESEVHSFCKERQCFEKYDDIMKDLRQWHPDRKTIIGEYTQEFFYSRNLPYYLSKYTKEIDACNKRRCELWEQNRNVPCFACKYYNRSLRILMANLFGIDDLEKEKEKENVNKSKTIVILRKIIEGGSSGTLRQNHMIQMAELLDCLGNSMLSCADITNAEGAISGLFLSRFLHDVGLLNNNLDKISKPNIFLLLQGADYWEEEEKRKIKFTKIETCILYYWEAYICFRYGNEQKKAAESIKKILRVFQNYLKVSEVIDDSVKSRKYNIHFIERKIIIGEFLNEIKNRLVKQSLICLYSHYNFINLMEIQRLKWIFYTQMYESISLDRLSLFPDVEEIMLTYYDLIRLCLVVEDVDMVIAGKGQNNIEEANKSDISKYNKTIEEVRKEYIEKFSRKNPNTEKSSNKEEGKSKEKGKDQPIKYSWNDIKERNKDFRYRLTGIYNNISMGTLGHHHSIYERILTLNFKAALNQYILELAFPEMRTIKGHDQEYVYKYIEIFDSYFSQSNHKIFQGEVWKWKKFFYHIYHEEVIGKEKEKEKEKTEADNRELIKEHLQVLEFLIRDSIYCLTEILETITPYTSTTLFTNSFMGSIYDRLHKWNIRFDALFKYYKIYDMLEAADKQSANGFKEWEQQESEFGEYDKTLSHKCVHMSEKSQSDISNANHVDCPYLEKIRFNENGNTITDEKRSDVQMKWQSTCPYYYVAQCPYKRPDLQVERRMLAGLNKEEDKKQLNMLREIWQCHNVSDRFFESVLLAIDKPNIHYTLLNYSMEMALKSYRSTIEMHREGKAYKDMISKMHYLDDDLKNDTVQFDLAVERFKINNGFIESNISELMKFGANSLYDIEKYSMNNESQLPLQRRFTDSIWNVYSIPSKSGDKN